MSRASSVASNDEMKAMFVKPSTNQAYGDGELLLTGSCEPREVRSGEERVLITEVQCDSPTDDLRADVENDSDKTKEGTQQQIDSSIADKSEKDVPEKPDIFDEQEWDTDLEEEDIEVDRGPPFRNLYRTICDKHGCSPNSYFLRHIEDKDMNLKHHGLTKKESFALGEILRSIICVGSLDLEDNWLRNVGCRQMCKMLLENDNIQDVNLSQNQLGMEAAVHLSRMLRSNHSLQSLSLAANGFEDAIAEILAESIEDCRLKKLRLSKNQFGDKTGQILGSVLAANDYIEMLDMSWNMVRGVGAVAIAKGLKENIRLKVLNLAWNGLGEKGGVALADALLVNSTLTELDISANRLSTNVAVRFAKVINASESLQVLQMNDNPISTAGAVTLATAVLNTPHTCLEHLGLQGNPVEYEFLNILRQLDSSDKNVTITYGSILRSGNTTQDLGKPAVGPGGPTKSIQVTEDQLIINNSQRFHEILARYYTSSAERGMCSDEELIDCLKILSPGLNNKNLNTVVQKLPRNHHNLISLRTLFDARGENRVGC